MTARFRPLAEAGAGDDAGAGAVRRGQGNDGGEWEGCLRELVESPAVSGIAVVPARRGARASYASGHLADGEGGEGVPEETVARLDAAFGALAAGEGEREALREVPALECCAGRRFVPLRLSFTSLYATSQYRRASLAVARLPFGYLLAVCNRPHRLEALVPLLERVADRFRS